MRLFTVSHEHEVNLIRNSASSGLLHVTPIHQPVSGAEKLAGQPLGDRTPEEPPFSLSRTWSASARSSETRWKRCGEARQTMLWIWSKTSLSFTKKPLEMSLNSITNSCRNSKFNGLDFPNHKVTMKGSDGMGLTILTSTGQNWRGELLKRGRPSTLIWI